MRGTVELFKTRARQPWRFRLRASNGEIVAQSEGYTRWESARRTAKQLADRLKWPFREGKEQS